MTERRFRRLSEIGPPPPREEIVEGLIGRGEVALLTGAPGCGKSTVAAGLAAAISANTPFLGRAVKPGAAVYLAAERATSVLRRLYAAGADADLVWVEDWAPSLADEYRAVIRAVPPECQSPALIVIDTVARVSAGADENAAGAMGLLVHAATELSRAFPSAAILLVHHTDKEGRRARGSNALVGGVDAEIRVSNRPPKDGRKQQDEEAEEHHAGCVERKGWLWLEKSNHSQTGRPLGFRLSLTSVASTPEVAAALLETAPALAKGAAAKRGEAEEWTRRLSDALPPGKPTAKDVEDAAERLGRFTPGMSPKSRRSKAYDLRKRVIEFRNGSDPHNAATVRNGAEYRPYVVQNNGATERNGAGNGAGHSTTGGG